RRRNASGVTAQPPQLEERIPQTPRGGCEPNESRKPGQDEDHAERREAHLERGWHADQAGVAKARDRAQEDDPRKRRGGCSDADHDQRLTLLHLSVVTFRGGAAIAACVAMRLAMPTSTSANTVVPSMKKKASALSAVAVAITLFRAALNSSPFVESW